MTGTAAPSGASAAPSLTEALADRLAAGVDAHARRAAAARVLDWAGCAVGALAEPLAAPLDRAVGTLAAPGAATRVGRGACDPAAALAWNGALGNALEMDDVHRVSILHPGPIVIPAALAACEATGAGSAAFLDAVVRGYEATIRVGMALGTSHYRFWHTTATAGSFGAAAAVASVLGLDPARTADALGTAGSTTGGLWQVRHEDAPTKSIHNAESARRGYVAAFLARAGVRGPRRILEGPQGLFTATAPAADPAAITAEAADWRIHETSLKPWPACRHAHPAIDALRRALAAGVDPAAVERVEIATYAEAIRFCDRPAPRTPAEARFSLQHAAAVVLARREPALADFTPEAIADPSLAPRRERVTVVEDPAASARFPAHYGASVTLTLDDGRRVEAAVRDAWGDPEWPLEAAEVRAKALRLMCWGGFDAARATRLADAALALADGGGLADFTAALGGAR
jgi:2-methylcitrate dehydratase PrpD